jgi:hypothetical protein
MVSTMADHAEPDGCDVDTTADPLPDEHVDLFVLFAEALDPANPITIEDVEETWGVG